MKKLYSAFAATLLLTGIAVAADEEQAPSATENMVKAESAFQETWVNPNFDFREYHNLFLWESYFEYRDVGPARATRSTMMNTHKREFGISENDRRKFEEVVGESFVKEIQKVKNLEIVDAPGPDTLILRGAAVDIVSQVPPELVGRNEIYLATIGEATLVLELIDAETGTTVAIVAERRAIKSGTGRVDQFSMPVNNATIIAEVRRWARSAAAKLRKELDAAVAGR
jgi:hypothetical protein